MSSQILILTHELLNNGDIELSCVSLDAVTQNPTGLQCTYVSSDTNIATVTGNIVTVITYGVFTITATQAGNGIYNPASTTEEFLVINEFSEIARPPTYVSPIEVYIGITSPDLSSLNITINTGLIYSNFTGIAYAINSVSPATVAKVIITATDASGQPRTDFSSSPLRILITIPMAADNINLVMYKLNVPEQPSGFPKILTYEGSKTWSVILESLSEYDVLSKLTQFVSLSFTSPVLFNADGTSPITFTYSSTNYLGAATNISPTVTSSNNNIATISTNNINILSPGKVTITASSLGNDDYLPSSVSSTLDIILRKTEQVNTNYLSSVLTITVDSQNPDARRINLNIQELQYARSANYTYAINTLVTGLLSSFSTTVLDVNNATIQSHSSYPLKITLDLPMAQPNNKLMVYQRNGNTIGSQPVGFPVLLEYTSNSSWVGYLPLSSDFYVIDVTALNGVYHYLLRVPITQGTLFTSSTYTSLIVNTTDFKNTIIQLLSVFYNTQNFDSLRAIEWSGNNASNENPNLASTYKSGYYNNTIQEFNIIQPRTLGESVLEIIAKGTFNHANARAAIANESSIKNLSILNDNVTVADTIVSQIEDAFSIELPDILNWYTNTYPLRDNENAPNFIFSGLTFTFFLIIQNEIVPTGDFPDSNKVPSQFSRIVKIVLEVD